MIEDAKTWSFDCFYCGDFRLTSLDGLEDLCRMVNQHNEQNHLDQNFAHWVPASMIWSQYYEGEGAKIPGIHFSRPSMRSTTAVPGPLPAYTRPHGLTSKEKNKNWEWGDADYAPVITSEDRAMLAKAKIKW